MAERRKPADVRAAAQALTPVALDALAQIVRTGSSEHARIAAATAIMDRAYGKPGQALKLGGEEGAAPILVRWAGTRAEATSDPSLGPVDAPRKSAET